MSFKIRRIVKLLDSNAFWIRLRIVRYKFVKYRFVRYTHRFVRSPVSILFLSIVSSRRLQDMSSRHFQDMSSRCLEDRSSRRLQLFVYKGAMPMFYFYIMYVLLLRSIIFTWCYVNGNSLRNAG